MKRRWFIIIAIAMLVLSNVACDDGGGDVPDVTGVESADEVIDDVRDAGDDATSILDAVWCLDDTYSWQIRCGGDGIAPTQ